MVSCMTINETSNASQSSAHLMSAVNSDMVTVTDQPEKPTDQSPYGPPDLSMSLGFPEGAQTFKTYLAKLEFIVLLRQTGRVCGRKWVFFSPGL